MLTKLVWILSAFFVVGVFGCKELIDSDGQAVPSQLSSSSSYLDAEDSKGFSSKQWVDSDDDISSVEQKSSSSYIIEQTIDYRKNNHAYLDKNRYYSSDHQIIQTVNQLKEYSIGYQFIDLGQVDLQGNLEDGIQDLLKNWIAVSKATDPHQKIIAVVNSEWRDAFFGSPSAQATLQAGIVKLIKDFDLDGVHLDIEPISLDKPNDEDYLEFVKNLKPLLGSAELSVTGVAWADVWSDAYIAKMAKVVDMINIMLYDTQGPKTWEPYTANTEEEYIQLWNHTIVRYSKAMQSTNPLCKLAPTMPVYDTRYDVVSGKPYHKPSIENIKNAAKGLNLAIAQGAKVYGAGLFWWHFFTGELTEGDKDPETPTPWSSYRTWWLEEWVHSL
jgi:hypothetical protein